MQYLLMIFEDEAHMQRSVEEKGFEAYMAPWMAYTEEMEKAGVMAGGNALEMAHTATTVSVRDGKRTIQDGPFLDMKEQLGGYYVLDVPGLDEAIKWAEKCPAAKYGHIELRPITNFDD
ncbi:YciI family protein [Parvularcula sp. ZS-1/3]|uniref:YciI family protein n=1 Tax=Parvularcula mediterranea TaxID=2732508 RepID=A0A7Y3RKB2_9PROT|nr:YciI family protein [Parvularcula mediterranea]NNU15628.1 YciI family protein [Parvularcula mediterranea]